MSDISVYAEGSSVIVDFGDMAISIPSRYNSDISKVKLDKDGVVYFTADEEDFLSIESTVFGEAPKFAPFKYSIIKDEAGSGENGLRDRIKALKKRGWVKDENNQSP